MRGVTRSCLMILGVMVATPALAGPFTVSSPSTATQVKIKIEAEMKAKSDQRTLSLPKLQLTLPITSDLNVAIKGHVRTIEKDGKPTETGIGDVEMKAKWNFLKSGKKGISMAIEPALSLPTGDHNRRLGEGRAVITLPVIVGYKTGPWELGGEIGYEHALGSANHDSYVAMLAMRRVSSNLRLGTELVAETEGLNFKRSDTRISAGFKLRIGKNGELQGLFGRTLHTSDHRATNRFKIAYEIKL